MPIPDLNGCGSYQIRRSAKFETTYENLIKKHYRKDTKSRKAFEKLVDDYVEELMSNPCSSCVSDDEGFPSDTAEQGFEFRKKRWRRLPGLQGGARFGRLIFVVYHPKKIVNLVWIYTHAEFQEPKNRPPERDLKAEVNHFKQEVLTEDLA